MVKRKKEQMDAEEVQVEVEAELEEVTEVPQPQVPDTSFDEIVDKVLRGEFGTGQDRRLRLSQAGYDHVAVEKAIVKKRNTK